MTGQLQRHLIRRYLLWAYKTTRESFERIERKTTQLLVDDYVLAHVSNKKGTPPAMLAEFKGYVEQKRKDELKLKYNGKDKKRFRSEYIYLKNRLAAIEGAVRHFLGEKEMRRMKDLFEEEFTRRILEARDH